MSMVVNLFNRTLGRFFTGAFKSQEGEQREGPASFGNSKKAGEITDERAMQLSAVWGCQTLLTDTVAMIPMKLYQRNTDGTRTEVRQHPLSGVFESSPNQYMSPLDFRSAVTFNLVGHGNGYAMIERNVNGDVIDLFPMPSPDVKQRIQKGVMAYSIDPFKDKWIDPSNIFHIRSLGYTGLSGLSTFQFARRVLGLSAAMQDHGETFFTNGAKPSGVFTIDKVLTKEQRKVIRENFLDKLEGEQNAFKTLLLEAGMTYQKMGFSPDDMQMTDQLRYSGEDICRFWRVPPNLLGFNVNSQQLTGLESINLAFLTYTLGPWLQRWASASTRQLLKPEERVSMFFEHDPSVLLEADLKAKSDYYSKMVQNGILNRNEARAKLNLKGYNAGGDTYTAQNNLVPVDKLGVAPSTAAPSEKEGDDGTQDTIRQ